jgi:hypothetical protein
MKVIDIIEEKYKVARRFYEANKETPKCSYNMGYMDALGELLEKIELEEEKKIPEKLNLGNATVNEQQIEFKINEIIDYLDYLKSKGE